MSDDGYFDDEYFDRYEELADSFPSDITEDQFEAALDLVDELMVEEGWEWEDIYDAIYEDFWEWFRENY